MLGRLESEAAERELLEETGHKSEGLMGLSLPVASDPGLTNVGMMVAEMRASKDRDETRMDPRDRLRIETTVCTSINSETILMTNWKVELWWIVVCIILHLALSMAEEDNKHEHKYV